MAHGYIGDDYGIDGGAENRERGSRDRDWRGQGSGLERSENRGYSANPDDHYRSWRDRHMQELDRQYADYCREREQHFHRDFDSWLSNRQHGNPQPLRTGMTQTGLSHEPEGELQLTDPAKAGMAESDPMDAATLGTTTTTGKQR